MSGGEDKDGGGEYKDGTQIFSLQADLLRGPTEKFDFRRQS